MRKKQKQQAEELIRQFEQAHEQIKTDISEKNIQSAMDLLSVCQDGGISLGTFIEQTEGEGHSLISLLEEYCELVYEIYQSLAEGKELSANNAYKRLRQKLIKISNGFRNDIKIRIEAVFLPYKASMWDSLESVWQAAAADPDCDAYVIPIPYYDKNPDGSFRKMHYEGGLYPDYVPITKYDEFDFGAHHPDMIFIHNPYDSTNFVTSIDPFFYSDKMKKVTDCLVYIPYYATAGGMSEGQGLCPAYVNADYIVIQSEKYRHFFDERIPDSKFLALGSPKFDSVIHKCQNPPAPPEEWKLSDARLEKMKRQDGDCPARPKVYFYNTSIGGMLGNTDAFLKKMRYVFDTFKGREDACLLWRPHPLMESTFDSMRKSYKPQYLALKKAFVEENIGILDETADIEKTIALCDAYIGDSATSVTSLFGVVGKPLFILNNNINTLPEKDDWRGERINLQFDGWGNDRYQVTRNNQLWFSEANDYHYKFYMDLGTGYSGGLYYMRAIEIGDKIYVAPQNAQHLLIIQDKRIRKIEFEHHITHAGAFRGYWYNEKYLFLYPNKYPFLIRFNIKTEEVVYIEGIQQFNVRNINGEWRIGGVGLCGNELFFASPVDNQFVFMDMDTLQARTLSSHSKCNLGTRGIITDGDNFWLMPLNGMTITCWNPKTGMVKEYNHLPPDFKSIKWPYETECEENPYGNIVFSKKGEKETIVIAPCWGNMYVSLDRETGRMEEWKPPITFEMRGRNGYFATGSMGNFIITYPQMGKADCRIWYVPERKLYDINIETKAYKEVEIEFDYDDLQEHEPGFMEESEWMQYCLNENAFNSLKDFLDDKITGNPFDRERQIRAFEKINADTNGTCGKNVYSFVKDKIL